MNDAAEEADLRILVADDRPFQRRLIAETLRALGRVDIDYAETAEQCLMALTYFEPDVIVLDWDIDDGHGLALVRRLRSGDAGDVARRLPLVMVTGSNTAGDVERLAMPASTSLSCVRSRRRR